MVKRLHIKIILIILCLITLGIGGFLFWASADIDSDIYIDTLCKGAECRRCVSLTFDDGPDEIMTPKVLDVLKKYNIKATFFIIGKKAERNPDIISRIVNEGHIIGCHSWSHECNFPLQSSTAIYNEICRCEELIFSLTGKTLNLFRPPFGVTNPLVAGAVKAKGYIPIGWSVRSYDTAEEQSREKVYDRVIRQLHNGAIILLHDRCAKADELVQLLIADLVQKDYEIINIDDMLDVEPYKNNVL